MKSNFDYLYKEMPTANVEIDDIGNCCIHAFNDDGFEWFLIITTILGDSFIYTFGPFHVEKEKYFPYGFNFSYRKVEYKEKVLYNIIDKFLNDNKIISQVILEEDSQGAYNKLLGIDFKEMK